MSPILISLEVALVATVLAGVVGVALAALLAHGRFFGSDVLDALLTAPMVLPPTVLGWYLLVVLGHQSAVGRAWEALTGSPIVFTRSAAVIAAAVAALPFVTRTARAAMEDVDLRLVGAARTLGAGPLRVLLTIVLPLSKGGVAAGLTLGFARALGEFGITLMLGGNLPGTTRTGALALYDAWQGGRDGDAATLALTLTLIGVVALVLLNRLSRRPRHGF